MKILITGSSGQIGTNLALRLLRGGHEVFGVDKRGTRGPTSSRYLLQDLAGHYAPFRGGINGVEYPETDLSSTSPRTRRSTSSCGSLIARSRTPR